MVYLSSAQYPVVFVLVLVQVCLDDGIDTELFDILESLVDVGIVHCAKVRGHKTLGPGEGYYLISRAGGIGHLARDIKRRCGIPHQQYATDATTITIEFGADLAEDFADQYQRSAGAHENIQRHVARREDVDACDVFPPDDEQDADDASDDNFAPFGQAAAVDASIVEPERGVHDDPKRRDNSESQDIIAHEHFVEERAMVDLSAEVVGGEKYESQDYEIGRDECEAVAFGVF